MGELAQLPRGGLDVLLADALHDPLDALLHRRLLLQQLRVRRVRLSFPQAVQPISIVEGSWMEAIGTARFKPVSNFQQFGPVTVSDATVDVPNPRPTD